MRKQSEIEQEATKGTHSHDKRKPTNAAQATNGNPPTRPLYVHLTSTEKEIL